VWSIASHRHIRRADFNLIQPGNPTDSYAASFAGPLTIVRSYDRPPMAFPGFARAAKE